MGKCLYNGELLYEGNITDIELMNMSREEMEVIANEPMHPRGDNDPQRSRVRSIRMKEYWEKRHAKEAAEGRGKYEA